MRLTHVRLLTGDFERALAFYRDVLGLEVSLEVEGVYAELASGGSILAIYRRDLMAQVLDEPAQGALGAALTFEVDDVDASFASLKEKGVGFITEPHDQEAWFIRVAHLRDPDGNLIELNHPLTPA